MGLFLYKYFDDYSQSYSGNTCGPMKYAAVKEGEIDLTLLTRGQDAQGKTEQVLLEFYASAPTSKAEPGTPDSAPMKSHPINSLITTLLQWFKDYYALDKSKCQRPEDWTSEDGPSDDVEDIMELGGGDEDLLALDAAAASVAANGATTTLTTAASDITAPMQDSNTQSPRSDPTAKMTHLAFKEEIYQEVRHRHGKWPRGDKGPDKRPRSFVVPGKNAAARAAAVAATGSGGSAQLNSTKRKQDKDSESKPKRRKGGQ